MNMEKEKKSESASVCVRALRISFFGEPPMTHALKQGLPRTAQPERRPPGTPLTVR